MPSHDTRTYPTVATLERATSATSLSDDELLARAEAMAADPDVLKEFKPWFFGARISTNALDSWGTVMDTTTLQNMARDARAGVTVLHSHNIEHVIGKSIDGRYVQGGEVGGTHTGQDTGDERTESVFTILSGQRTANGMMTDDVINQIRFSAYKDISVGFTLPPDAYIQCSLCGKRMNEWFTDEGCWHFPGVWMDVDVEGQGRQRRFVTGKVVNGGLSEYSPVYDGATPGAEVIPFTMAKAFDMEEVDELDRDTAERLTNQFNVRFRKAGRRPFALGGLDQLEGSDMARKRSATNSVIKREEVAHVEPEETPAEVQVQDDQTAGTEATTPEVTPDGNPEPPVATPEETPEDTTTFPDYEATDHLENPAPAPEETPEDDPAERLTEAQVRALNTRYADTGIRFAPDAVDALVTKVTNLGELVRTLNATIAAQKPEVEAGRAYRKDLVDQVIHQAKRAHPQTGSAFDEQAVRSRIDRPSNTIDDLVFFRDQYKATADARFARPEGGPRLLPLDDNQGAPTNRGGRRKPGRLIHQDDDAATDAG